ncbi:hypothetical protein [Desulfobacter sp.]
MKVQLIMPVIACVFILLSIYQLAAAYRNAEQCDDASRIIFRGRRRLGFVFLLVGAGLLGYYWFPFY